MTLPSLSSPSPLLSFLFSSFPLLADEMGTSWPLPLPFPSLPSYPLFSFFLSSLLLLSLLRHCPLPPPLLTFHYTIDIVYFNIYKC